jgi:hypothetical protein
MLLKCVHSLNMYDFGALTGQLSARSAAISDRLSYERTVSTTLSQYPQRAMVAELKQCAVDDQQQQQITS